jgi:hypothetical protein
MRKPSWTPSIVPNDNDETVYLVADDFGRLGRAWREADYEAADPGQATNRDEADYAQQDRHRRD